MQISTNYPFKMVDEEFKHTLMNMFKKVGRNDCGLVAIAVASDLAHGKDPANVFFEQNKMRDHLMRNLESGSLQQHLLYFSDFFCATRKC